MTVGRLVCVWKLLGKPVGNGQPAVSFLTVPEVNLTHHESALRSMRRAHLLGVAAAAAVLLLPTFALLPHRACAQSGGGSASQGQNRQVRVLMRAHEQAQRSHLWRVAVWGGANLAAGIALMGASRRSSHPARFGYGLQSGIWGAVNLGIVGVGLSGGGPGAATGALAPALDAVRGYHDILLLNMGLNVAYTGVGAALLAAGYRDVESAASWRGHGAALIVQGLGLLALDGMALWGARGRLAELVDLAGRATLSMGPTGARLVLSL